MTLRPPEPTQAHDWQIAEAAEAGMKSFAALGRELGLQNDEMIPMGS